MSKELRLYAAILDQNVVLVASMAGCGEQKEERRREKGGGAPGGTALAPSLKQGQPNCEQRCDRLRSAAWRCKKRSRLPRIPSLVQL